MRYAPWITVLVFAAACGTDSATDGTTGDSADGSSDDSTDSSDGTEECMQGETMACECAPNSVGTMRCDANGVFGACGECADPDPDPNAVNFQAEIVPIINRSCGTNGVTGCHARDAYGASMNQGCRGWLTLENVALGAAFYSGPREGEPTGCPDMPLYERLTQIDVWQCLSTSVAYIAPGDPAQSYIMNKLNGVNLCRESASSPSVQMPPDDSMFSITVAERALIEQWIAEGALNN